MAEDQYPFRDPRLPVGTRIEDLLARLTPDERIAMPYQFAPGVERLGVGAFRGAVRAGADQSGGWAVQETFTLEEHSGGHLLKHIGTGRYVSVAADVVKVADEGEVFRIEVAERGQDAVTRAAAAADVVIVVAGNDPRINGRETEDRTTPALPPHQDRLWRAALAANPRTALVLVSAYPYAVDDTELPAVVWTAHGGQSAGSALARVLRHVRADGGRVQRGHPAHDRDPGGVGAHRAAPGAGTGSGADVLWRPGPSACPGTAVAAPPKNLRHGRQPFAGR